MAKLGRIHVILHRLGYDTKRCKEYTAKLKEELKRNWWVNHREYYWNFYHKVGDSIEEYEQLVRDGNTPWEAYYKILTKYD